MKLSASVLLVAVVACDAGVGAQREFDGEAALRYVEAQLAFGPRIPGTEAHRQTGDWILEALRAQADSVEVQAFTHVTVDGDTLQLRNFIGRFRPEETGRVLYMAHWDTRPRADQSSNIAQRSLPVPGANDGASGVAVLLGVADALSKKPPAFGVDLVFVDGEDYGDWGGMQDVLLGSRYYAEHLAPAAHPLFAVVWDIVGAADLRLTQERNSVRFAPEVVERVWNKASELGYGGIFRATVGGQITDDHIPLQNTGVRAIDVVGLPWAYWHTTDDTLDKVSAESLQAVGDVAVALVR